MFTRLLIILTFAFFPVWLQAQTEDSTATIADTVTEPANIEEIIHKNRPDPVSKELDFIHYLVSNELYADAQFALNALGQDQSMSQNQTDSIAYFQGWLRYHKRDFDHAHDHFSHISKESHLIAAASFFSVMCLLELKRTAEAEALLKSIDVGADKDLIELKTFYLSGFALLNRDYGNYDSLVSTYSSNSYLIATERANFNVYSNDLRTYKDKSPLLAGFLSALIPGLGKFYAGYRGQPFGALAITLPFAAPAIELAILAGLTSPLFIASGALFGLFYIGNIWGSALSVRTHKADYYAEIDYNIVIDLHLPLRRVF